MQRSRYRHRRDSREMEMQLRGYRLSTAEIIYRMPDYLKVLQTFIWQLYDMAPDYPELKKFLDFWRDNLDGPLHSVSVMTRDLVSAGRYRNVDLSLALH
jgi:uncharacterized protein Usg